MLPRRLRTLEVNLRASSTAERAVILDELGRMHHPYVLDLLYPLANSDDPEIRAAAIKAFEVFSVANPKVAMRHGSTFIRHEAAYVLGQLKCLAAVDELARVVRNDSDEALRLACVQALSMIGSAQAVPGLRTALRDASLKVRQASFEGLRAIGGPAVENAVADLLSDHDWELRQKAHALLQTTGWIPTTRQQKALWGIMSGRFDDVVCQGPEAIEPLLMATLRVNDPAVRKWSATALARVGSPEVRRRLRGAVASPDPAIRLAAQEALNVFGESIAHQPVEERVEFAQTPARHRQSTSNIFSSTTWFLSLMGHP